jgi:MFS family permease
MTILDRYLAAVQKALPKELATGDVVAEIADDLHSQVEEREAAAGRALTDDELASIVKAYGHPRVVAARYERVTYLIGPDAFPFYRSALGLVATIVVAIELIGGGIGALLAHNGILFFSALEAAWKSLIWIFGIVTIVFALAERSPNGVGSLVARFYKWDPRQLPDPGQRPPAKRGPTLIEFIANFLMLLVLLDAAEPHHVPLDELVAGMLATMHATLMPSWQALYVGTIAGTAVLALGAIVVFVQPRWSAVLESARAISSVAVIIGIAFTLHAGTWIQSPHGGLNTIVLYALVSALVVLAIQLTVSVNSLLRYSTRRT